MIYNLSSKIHILNSQTSQFSNSPKESQIHLIQLFSNKQYHV